MKRIVLVVFLGGFASLVGFRLYQEMTSETVAAGAAATPGPGGGAFGGGFGGAGRGGMLVETAHATPFLFESRLEFLGELRPQASVEVMSRIGGYLRQVLVESGDFVRAGQRLAQVDDTDLQQQIRRAEAAVSVARAGVSRERATLENVRVQVGRAGALHEEGLTSAQELQDVESRLRVAEAQLQLAEAQVEQAEASLQELLFQRSQTEIHAPMDGFVGARHLDPGALVNPNVPILSLIDTSRVKTVVQAPESVLRQIRVGLPADIEVDAERGRVHRGAVTRISPILQSETRTADVEIEVQNRNGDLRPGMFARVRIDVGSATPSLSVPRAALLTRGNRQGVYLLGEGNTALFQPIEVGRIHGDRVEVIGGIDAGAEVISAGAQNINDGDRVRTQ